MAVINAGALTGMRTGATAAVGAKYLARSDASSLLMVGTGMLAAYSIPAILLACPWIESVNLKMRRILSCWEFPKPLCVLSLNIPSGKRRSVISLDEFYMNTLDINSNSDYIEINSN